MNTNCTYLGHPVAHCTPGVRLRGCSHQFTIPWNTICSEWHFRTSPVRHCMPTTCPTITTALSCVYTNCTYLGDIVAHCTPALRLRDRLRQFTLPCTTICSERHFRTPSVCTCTIPKIRMRTAHLDCVNTNCTYLGHPVAHCTPGVRLRDYSY